MVILLSLLLATVGLPRLLKGLTLSEEPAGRREEDLARHEAAIAAIAAIEEALRLAALHAEREAIFKLARGYTISDEISRKLVRQIDQMEARYR